jgi:hypothetical protein
MAVSTTSSAKGHLSVFPSVDGKTKLIEWIQTSFALAASLEHCEKMGGEF